MAQQLFVGIRKIWYTDVYSTPTTLAAMGAAIKSIISDTATISIKNVQNELWNYTETDVATRQLKNGLNGVVFWEEKTSQGIPTFEFNMGSYEFKQLGDLVGGESSETDGYARATDEEALALIRKCVIAQTKSLNYIIFPCANIIAQSDTQDFNITLRVRATMIDQEINGLSPEYRIPNAKVKSATVAKAIAEGQKQAIAAGVQGERKSA
jgi:hypothetical protein